MQSSAFSFSDQVAADRLSEVILAERSRTHESLLAAAAVEPGPTLLLDVLADALIDRCAQALADRNEQALIDWAVAECRARAGAPAVQALFLALGPALAQALGDADARAITAPLDAAVRGVRPSGITATAGTLDELDLTLAELVARVESNDPMTAEHCRAVSAWCARIAQKMSLTRAEAVFVARGGLIHDVGKLTTPAEILLAPRPLTDAEWFVMREHVTAGHEIVRHGKLRDFGGIVRSHHERVDGRGYPDGLDRARIPLAVRIVTVADAFNAMIGRRVYRRPYSPDFATSELRRHAGTQFDPNVVEALIDVVSAGHDRARFERPVA